MRQSARVVVIGGGNMGAAVLYHLALEGWTDCLLVEKAELTSGATWHAAGLISRMTAAQSLGRVQDYGVDLYKRIGAETGQAVGWHGCGSLRVAATEDHRDWLMHIRDGVLGRGQECHWLSPAEVRELNPLYDTRHVIGGLFTPDDGHVDPSGACQAMARGARQMGAEIVRRNRVTGIRALPSGEWAVETEQGMVTCEHVVNAGGYHARQIGACVGLDLPIVPMQHHYLVTEPVPEFADRAHEIPVTRDDHFTGYLRREQAGALIGLYDTHDARPRWVDGCPWESENELFEPDFDRITPWLEKCFERFPSLTDLGIKRIVNGAITYTPDGAPLVGPAPGLRNFWLACGATVGIAWGPGLGRALAQWMVHGCAEVSMRGFDPRRFGRWADAAYALARSREDYMTRLSLHYPQEQSETCRGLRRSGAHRRTAALGAIYEAPGAWERPRLYAPADWQGREPRTWRHGPSRDVALAEARSVHAAVGLGDFSAFAKFEISGAGATAWLDRLCANRLPLHPGGTCLTLMLNRQGRIEGEATVVRLGAENFWLVTGTPSEGRVWDWLALHNPPPEGVRLTNRSDEIGILTLAGPKARVVLGAAAGLGNDLTPLPCGAEEWGGDVPTAQSLTNADFPWLSTRRMTITKIPVLGLRLSFTGLLAWELHAPNDRLGDLWETLWQAGQPHGITPFGSKALDLLRIEKAYRGGAELSGDASPVQAGEMRFVRLDKSFLGRGAVKRLAQQGEPSMLAYLELAPGEADATGGEAVFLDGRLAGAVASGSTGATTGKALAFAYLKPWATAPGTALEVSVLGERRAAKVLAGPVLDPKNRLIKA